MIQRSTICWVSLAAITGGMAFNTSYHHHTRSSERQDIDRRIDSEQEAIHLLRAEWSYLNDPVRIERLARQFTRLQPAIAEQMSTLTAIPARPPAPTGTPATANRPAVASSRPATRQMASDR